MSSQEYSLRCPWCGQMDAVYKVSALYEYGFSTQTYQKLIPPPVGTSWAPLFWTEDKVVQSQLSKKLAPPARPIEQEVKHENWKPSPTVALASSLLFIAAIFGGLVTMSGSPVIGLSIIGFSLITIWILNKGSRIAAEVAYENAVREWQSACYKWEQLYYCARDDGVFLPSEGRFIPAHNMQAYLYE